MTERQWLAAYLYRAEPWERFLQEAVRPFVAETLEAGLAAGYFFIRYWERGPHIRLRFLGDPDVLARRLKPRLDDFFGEYFKRHPSERREPEYPESFPEEQRWFPNDTVQYIDYEPEVKRYAGPAGMPIAETQFQASSDAVLALLGDEPDYDRALGAAIQMHLTFAHSLGLSLSDLRCFATLVFRGWLGRAYAYKQDAEQDYHLKMQEETLAAFRTTFENQRDTLVSFGQTLWSALDENVEFEQEWLNKWRADIRVFGREFGAARDAGLLELPDYRFPRSEEMPVSEELQRYWFVLESFVHMTNNRLGVLNRDEAFLGYLIRETSKLIQI